MTFSALAEFADAVDSLTQGDVDSLLAAGVARETIFLSPLCPLVGAAHVIADSDGCFAPDSDGRRAFILAANLYGTEGAMWVDDLVAWFACQPARWWRRTKVAAILNESAIDQSVHLRYPLRLCRTPLGWLRGGALGAVILDASRFNVRLRLCDVPRIIADDLAHGRDIERQLRAPILPMPRISHIRVPSDGRGVALGTENG